MRAAVYRRAGEVEVTEVEVPAAGDGRALVEVDYCGICGTDLHMVLDGWGTPGSVFGHEFSGRIVKSGTSGLAPGTAVVGLPSVPCGHCDRCEAGRTSLCRNRTAAGNGVEHGAFARFVELDAPQLIAVPDGIDTRLAAYAEPLAVALHAVTLFGNWGERTCPRLGCRTDRSGDHRDPATPRDRSHGGRAGRTPRRAGGTTRARTVVPADLTTPAHPGETVPDAVDVVFETSGSRSATEAGLAQLTSGGLLMLVGTGMDYPKLDTNRVILNELRVTGAFNYDADGFRAALDLIANGALPLDELIEPQTVGLEDMLDAMRRLRAGELAGKVMVKP